MDEIQATDLQLWQNGIPLIVDSLTRTLLGEELTLNYNPKFGFALSSPQEIFSFTLDIMTLDSKN